MKISKLFNVINVVCCFAIVRLVLDKAARRIFFIKFGVFVVILICIIGYVCGK